MKNVMSILSVIAALTGCVSCSKVKSYSSADFEKLLQENHSMQLVDVRHADEYAAGHIENAILIDVTSSDFMAKSDSLLDKSKPVAVYCKGGVRSLKAASQLEKAGFQVSNLKKGYDDWVAYQKSK